MEHNPQTISMNPSFLVELYGAEAASTMQPYRRAVCESCGWHGPTYQLDPNDMLSVEKAIDSANADVRKHRETPEAGAPQTVPFSSVTSELPALNNPEPEVDSVSDEERATLQAMDDGMPEAPQGDDNA